MIYLTSLPFNSTRLKTGISVRLIFLWGQGDLAPCWSHQWNHHWRHYHLSFKSSCFVLVGLTWGCQVGSAVLLSGGNPAVPNRSVSRDLGSLHQTPELMWPGLQPSSNHHSTKRDHSRTFEADWLWRHMHSSSCWSCFLPMGWQTVLTLGHFLMSDKKFSMLYFSKGAVWFSFSQCTKGCCLYNTEIFSTKNDKDVKQRVSW